MVAKKSKINLNENSENYVSGRGQGKKRISLISLIRKHSDTHKHKTEHAKDETKRKEKREIIENDSDKYGRRMADRNTELTH